MGVKSEYKRIGSDGINFIVAYNLSKRQTDARKNIIKKMGIYLTIVIVNQYRYHHNLKLCYINFHF